jgi:uncharacterized protein YydD (DUF2326 family)
MLTVGKYLEIQRWGRGRSGEVGEVNREELYKQELAKLEKLFKDVEPKKTELTEGLRQDAAFLLAENAMLKHHMRETGMIKIHPEYPEIQKSTEAAKQYLKNVNSYAVVIKTLNGILSKDLAEGDDEFTKFLREMHGVD